MPNQAAECRWSISYSRWSRSVPWFSDRGPLRRLGGTVGHFGRRAADWHEREAHDLFGVSFEGPPDLAPLLLYDDFEGYPGRKEFPFNEYREF